MQVIGITGKSGTGKSTFSKILIKNFKNSKIINIDKIGHLSLKQETVINGLREKFGDEVLDTNGNINRKKLGSLVFAKSEDMDYLTDLTWEFMKQELNKILSSNLHTVILEWALLPKTEFWDMCNTKILIHSDEEQRKNEVIKRDNITEEYFYKRDDKSLDYTLYKFDYIVENSYDNLEFEEIVNNIYKEIIL